jgi:UDP-N-acetylglucosamine diphosphorylase/glucosamine-1-phosphate N-acetyltransferase
MNVIFFDDQSFNQLLPLTFTKPVSELRVGILKIREKWELFLHGLQFSYFTKDYLSEKFPANIESSNLLVSSSLIPDKASVDAILALQLNECLIKDNRILACRAEKKEVLSFNTEKLSGFRSLEYNGSPIFLNHPWEIFLHNGFQIEADFNLLTRDRKSNKLSNTLHISGENIFVEEGVKAEYATINTTTGPVYLGKNSEIMEGSVIRGPFALCEGSVVKLSAKIYGPTTIGPHSKVGGEINNSVIQGYSNKAHDGFLGNSVIGEWCNLGADTNNSNLKNNYAEVRLWSYPEERFVNTGLQFCGLIMGDHSKCGINTMFNTGTVVGVNANIFGSGFPRNFVPSFSWGGAHGFTTYSLTRAFEVASMVMERRGVDFNETEQKILKEVFKMTEKYRK